MISNDRIEAIIELINSGKAKNYVSAREIKDMAVEILMRRQQVVELIENSKRLDMWVMVFTNLCVCDCNNDTNKIIIERYRNNHKELMERVNGNN